MNYEPKELLPIVAELAEKYVGCDSTSISYETAQMLMEGVIYCLEEGRLYSKMGLRDNKISVREQYNIGKKLVKDKAVKSNEIFNEMSEYFDDYGVECLYSTVQRGIPEFFKWYDVKFCPQNTILTLDYPILKNIQDLSGVDAIYEYIRAIRIEQLFLRKMERNYVITVLKCAIPKYKDMIENICEMVLLNMIGHIILKKPFQKFGFTDEDFKVLKKIFKDRNITEIEKLLEVALSEMVEQIYDGNWEMLEYFANGIENMAVRIESVAKVNHLERIFVV